MYKRVLLPVSNDPMSKRALKALNKAKHVCDGEIILLHVTEPVAQTVGGEAREELQNQHKQEGLMALGPVVEKLESENIPFHTRIVPGLPADIIPRIADEEDADLIIMFTDGRDGISDMLLGSITERVLRNTNRDLLAVRN